MSCYVIAEAGLNHNGSFKIAKDLIEVAAESGANAVKFQKRDVDRLAISSVLNAPDNRFPSLGSTYRKVRETLEFSLDQYHQLKEYAEAKGLDFLCTAFDQPSVDFLEKLNVSAYKIASHSLTNLPLLRYIASKGKPVYMSSGMCTWEELDAAVNTFVSNGNKLVLFHCVSVYPTPPEESNLLLIETLRQRYQIPVGFSGHEIGYLATLVAVGLGAVAVERHYTLDKKMEGFDHKISLEPGELQAMVRDIRLVEKCLGQPNKTVSEKEMATRKKYHVSMVSACPIPAGAVLTQEMVAYKNPGTGIPFKEAHLVMGRRAVQNIPVDKPLEKTMFD